MPHIPLRSTEPDSDWGAGLPDGWLDCPAMGRPCGFLIPIKVPLGAQHAARIPEHLRFTPHDVVEQLQKQNKQVGMVIDLTNTWRYYDIEEWHSQGIDHVKVHCQPNHVPMRGRGAVPTPASVNQVFWMAYCFKANPENRDKFIVIHCTHGFNRTAHPLGKQRPWKFQRPFDHLNPEEKQQLIYRGCPIKFGNTEGYVVVSTAVRLSPYPTVDRAVFDFKTARPPGIYKDDYLSELFKYHHERRPSGLGAPEVPLWKGDDEEQALQPEEAADLSAAEAEIERPMEHDDLLGEPILEEEEVVVQREVMQLMYQCERLPDPPRFPGSQPVSLAKANWGMLRQQRFWATWKADGTRYMLLLTTSGVYAIDRAFRVRRLQMRFPKAIARMRKGLLDGPQNMTLLDGEMVVDEDIVTGQRKRRYLAYDVMLLHGKSIIDLPFKDRYRLLDKEVIQPRQRERSAIESGRGADCYQRYLYAAEEFSVRRKEFWPLGKADVLLNEFIPKLSHEADGLIFQPWESPYIIGTANDLLKWKYAHLNSVDFKFMDNSGRFELCLLQTRGPRDRQGLQPLPGAKVVFPEGDDAQQYINRVIECSWDLEKQAWVYMRERRDKDTPNAYHVYEKVVQSITDDLNQDALLDHITKILQAPLYDKDEGRAVPASGPA